MATLTPDTRAIAARIVDKFETACNATKRIYFEAVDRKEWTDFIVAELEPLVAPQKSEAADIARLRSALRQLLASIRVAGVSEAARTFECDSARQGDGLGRLALECAAFRTDSDGRFTYLRAEVGIVSPLDIRAAESALR